MVKHTLKTVPWSPQLEAQRARVQRAATRYPNEDEGMAPLELEQLRFARLMLRTVDAAQQARLARLPRRGRVIAAALRPSSTRRKRSA